jgi:TrmH family RNA methyltransferase
MPKLISSRQHPLFKQIKSLARYTTQYKRDGYALIEGTHLAQAWLATRGLPEYCISTQEAQQQPEIAQLMTSLPSQRCIFLSAALFRELSHLTQGTSILFLIKPIDSVLPQMMSEDCVVLDRIQDPGNVGSILRSSAAAGVKHIFCLEGSAAVWSPKVLRAGMGAQFQLNIIEQLDVHNLISKLTLPVLVACAQADKNLFQANLRQPVAWVFGNEGQGVCRELMDVAQHFAIPQPGGTESLNVAAAAAVCLFETLRQRFH